MTERVHVSLALPRWLHRPLSAAKHLFTGARARSSTKPNLLGDRDVEWSWTAAHIPLSSGKALDFGCGNSPLGLCAAEAGFDVVCYDLSTPDTPYRHERLSYQEGDILKDHLEPESLDLIINCSAIEHVGLSGRYGVTEDISDGDLVAMDRLRSAMRPGARMLLTIPVGKDAVFAPMTRVYGEDRLPILLEGFSIESSTFWSKKAENAWEPCDRSVALSFEAYAGSPSPMENCYALGCFKLRKPMPTRAET